MSAPNRIYAFVGTTAAGKTYFSKHLVGKYGMQYIPSVTSRDPRPDNLSEYKHVSRLEFETLVADEKIFEYTTFNGNYYGKLHEDIENNLAKSHCVYTITADRVAELKMHYPETIVFCITVEEPVVANTIKRLKKRGHSSEEIKSKITTIAQDIHEIDILETNGLIDHKLVTVQGSKAITFEQLESIIDIYV